MSRWAILSSEVAVTMTLSPVAAHACSVCGGSAIGTDPGTGFNTSILFLLSMPYAVVAVIAGWLIYTSWRTSSRRRKKFPVQYLLSKEGER